MSDCFLLTMAYEPSARMFHAALPMGNHMFMWGGITSEDSSPVKSSVVECFNVLSYSWEQPRRLLNEVLPVGYSNMAVASDGENSYLFGGTNKSEELCSEIYEVRMPSLECKKLVPTADPINTRGLSALVCVNRTLISYGGVIDKPHTMPTLSKKLFVFDLIESECVAITCNPSLHRFIKGLHTVACSSPTFAFMLLLISQAIITAFACIYCIFFIFWGALNACHL